LEDEKRPGRKSRLRKSSIEEIPVSKDKDAQVTSSLASVQSSGSSSYKSSIVNSTAQITRLNKVTKAENDCEIIIESDNIKQSSFDIKDDDVDARYACPIKDCPSESKSAQSIKVHLALVHYKKSIQSEFPNWKKQKCDECDKSFGQMTAYYLHMANHKKYQFMDLSAQSMLVKDKSLPVGSKKPQDPKFKVIGGGISSELKVGFGSSSSSTATLPIMPGSILKPSTLGRARSSSFGNSGNVAQVIKVSDGSGLTRSKSFIQEKAPTTPTVAKIRPAPPGPPPGPPIMSKPTSQTKSQFLIPSSISNPMQRRLSLPTSGTKRTSERLAVGSEAKKTRGT